MLLAAAWKRLLVAGVAVAALWAAVLWVAPSTPSTAPAQPSVACRRPARHRRDDRTPVALRAVVRSGQPAPGGGSVRSVRRSPRSRSSRRSMRAVRWPSMRRCCARRARGASSWPKLAAVTKVAAFGDRGARRRDALRVSRPHPLPALNAAGHVAFVAQIAGGRATEGDLPGRRRRAAGDRSRRR